MYNYCLAQLNGVDLREVAHQRAVAAFHGAGDRITLLVERGAERRIRVSHPPILVHIIVHSLRHLS